MKKISLAIALLTVLPLAAQAQTSVTIYGIADASVGIEDTDAPGTDSRTVISSGTQRPAASASAAPKTWATA